MVHFLPQSKRSRHRNSQYGPATRLRVLLTNGRFSVTLDLARQLFWAGHHVYCVDPLEYHVCKFSFAVKKSRQVPAPQIDPKGYCDAVAKAIADWAIDLVIPLHDEIFFLAGCDQQQVLDKLLAPSFDLLVQLYNKWELGRLLRNLGLGAPQSYLCQSLDDVYMLDRSMEWVLKPVYAAASSKVYHLKPGLAIPEELIVSEDKQYIAQVYVRGSRYCSYTLVRKGRLQAHALYPVEEMLDGTYSVRLEQVKHDGIKAYVQRFAAAFPDLTAQLAFDFVDLTGCEDGSIDGLLALECRPRATPSIYLWSSTPYLARALTNTLTAVAPDRPDFTSPPPKKRGHGFCGQLASDMMMWTHSTATQKHHLKHIRQLMSSKDVTLKIKDFMPTLMQPFLLAVYYDICREKKQGLRDMLLWDLTWKPDDTKAEWHSKMWDDIDVQTLSDRKDSSVSA